jgi:hypothetical protein
MTKNYQTFLHVGQKLSVGDTVSSPSPSPRGCVMQLQSSGISLQYGVQPPYQPPNASGLVLASGAELTPTYFIVFATPNDQIYFPLTATMLEVQDNGQVIIYGQGSPYALFTYQSPSDLVVVSQAALTELAQAVDVLQAKVRAMKQTVRPFPGVQGELDPSLPRDRTRAGRRFQSGFAGPINSATKVATKKVGS